MGKNTGRAEHTARPGAQDCPRHMVPRLGSPSCLGLDCGGLAPAPTPRMPHDSPWALGSLALLGLRSSPGRPCRELQARQGWAAHWLPWQCPDSSPHFMVEEGGTPSASWPASPSLWLQHTWAHGFQPWPLPGEVCGPQTEMGPAPSGSQRVWTCPTVGPRPGAVTPGQAMTSTMLQLGWAGLGWARAGLGWAPTPSRGT